MKDVEEIGVLLHIHEKAIAHGGALNHIANAAMLRLQEINAELDPRRPSTHVRTAFDKEVPPRVVTPPEGPANSAVELPDGEIESIPDAVSRGDIGGPPVNESPSGDGPPPFAKPDEVPIGERTGITGETPTVVERRDL